MLFLPFFMSTLFTILIRITWQFPLLVSSFPFSWITLVYCTVPYFVCKTCHVSGAVEYFVSALCDHVLHSATIPNYLFLDVQRYSQYGLFLRVLISHCYSFFMLVGHVLLAYNITDKPVLLKRLGLVQLRFKNIFKRGKCLPSWSYFPPDFIICVLAHVQHPSKVDVFFHFLNFISSHHYTVLWYIFRTN